MMRRAPFTVNRFLLTLFLLLMPASAMSQTDKSLEHAKAIIKAAPIIDGHNDLAWEIRTSKTAPFDVDAYDLRQTTPGHTDFARLAAGGVGGQFWSIYVPGEVKDSGYARIQLEEFDIARRFIAKYPDKFTLALTAADIEAANKAGKIASLLGMEGGHAIENSLGALRMYYELGARYMTLTHNVTLDWADAALDQPVHSGLTAFGREVVLEMNRLGMMVDLSHVSPGVMSDALDVTQSPVIFSHSSARALVDHPRNVPDSILARMPKNGGVVMVTFVPAFVSNEVMQWEAKAREWKPRGGRRGGHGGGEGPARGVAQGEPGAQGDAGRGGRPHRPREEARWRRSCRASGATSMGSTRPPPACRTSPPSQRCSRN